MAESGNDIDDERLEALAARVVEVKGGVVALKLDSGWQELIWRLRYLDVDVRMVLGTACTTALNAVKQFTAALQLPLAAAWGWQELLDHLDERSGGSYVVVTNACEMLKYEDRDLWDDLVRTLQMHPGCLFSGFCTLVLIDNEYSWNDWVFKSTAGICPT